MKYPKFLTLLLLSSVLFFFSCKDNKNTPKKETLKPAVVSPLPNVPTTTPPATKEPAQNTAGVWHYTCTKGCVGGAGKAVNCNTCGSILTHNTAYHSNTKGVQSSSPFATPPPPPRTPEPAQNAAGVWHYTCGKGCAGGSGSATPCVTCKSILTHNKAYHQ